LSITSVKIKRPVWGRFISKASQVRLFQNASVAELVEAPAERDSVVADVEAPKHQQLLKSVVSTSSTTVTAVTA
jgi:hypothetical protein